jgi:hypothetical protein
LAGVGAIVAAAWSGLARPGSWDPTPILWAGLLLLAVWVFGGRLRWWVPPAALGAGLPCSTVAEHFGPVAGLAFVLGTALAAVPLLRARHRS